METYSGVKIQVFKSDSKIFYDNSSFTRAVSFMLRHVLAQLILEHVRIAAAIILRTTFLSVLILFDGRTYTFINCCI